MKKRLHIISILVVLASFLPTGNAHARSLTPTEALARVEKATTTPARLRAKVTSSHPRYTVCADNSDLPTIYIFNCSNGGYILVSADDAVAPLLGYTDSGDFDVNDCAPAFRSWMEEYSRQITYAASKQSASESTNTSPHPNLKVKKKMDNRDLISPLLTTKWGQQQPFNLYCPNYGDTQTVTGCVATALAQMLSHYKYPVTGNGTHSYKWTRGGKTLSYNYDNAKFDYSLMRDNFVDSDYFVIGTQEQQNAVSDLMYACGVGVNMNYGTAKQGGSGASSFLVGRALYENFNYDSSLRIVWRDSYLYAYDWDELIYQELAHNRPVYYSGATQDDSGHAFVCDGYDGDGFFHINWGWYGISDGCFLLCALDPDEQGTGGSDSGYDYGQCVYLGVQPPGMSDEVVDPHFVIYGNSEFEVSRDELHLTVKYGNKYGSILSYNWMPMPVNMGFVMEYPDGRAEFLFTEENSVEYPAMKEDLSVASLSEYSVPFSSANLAAGVYKLTPTVRYQGEWFEIRPFDRQQRASQYMVVYDSGKISFENTNPNLDFSDLEIIDLDIKGEIIPGEDASFGIKIQNRSKVTNSGNLQIWIGDYPFTQWYENYNLSLGQIKGLSRQFYKFTLPDWKLTEGLYSMYFYDDNYSAIPMGYIILVGRQIKKLEAKNNTLTYDLSQITARPDNVVYEPTDASVTRMIYTSSNPNAVSVDSDGVLTFNAAGEADITVSTTDMSNLSVTFTVIVTNDSSQAASLNNNIDVKYNVTKPDGTLVMRSASCEDLEKLLPGLYIISDINGRTIKLLKR